MTIPAPARPRISSGSTWGRVRSRLRWSLAAIRRLDLLGTLLVVSLGDEAIVLCARSHAHGPVLLRPESDVEPGTIVA